MPAISEFHRLPCGRRVHQHAARLRHDRKNVARRHECPRACRALAVANRARSLHDRGGDSGGHARQHKTKGRGGGRRGRDYWLIDAVNAVPSASVLVTIWRKAQLAARALRVSGGKRGARVVRP